MSPALPPRHTLESLKKEAKRWHAAMLAGDAGAHARYRTATGASATSPSLRDVQLALARELGYPGWAALKTARTPNQESAARSVRHYQEAAEALHAAYHSGTPEAMERHYLFTWHRRPWQGMRTYAQLDLGRRPDIADAEVPFTLDDARSLVAREHGFDDWERLCRFTESAPAGTVVTAKPMGLLIRNDAGDEETILRSRDWHTVLHVLAANPGAMLDGNGQVTDAMVGELVRHGSIAELRLGGSRGISDEGVVQLTRLENLRTLDLSGTAVTDRGLAALGALGGLESLSLVGTAVTDAGMQHLSGLDNLRRLNLMGTTTGDGAIGAMAGKSRLSHLQSGSGVSDSGLALLHELPVFKRWHGGEPTMDLLSYSAEPNQLLLRGGFTDRGLASLRGLDGLFGLNLDASDLAITARGIGALAELPHLAWLAVDARDDWMPAIAALPALRFLGAQDTSAADDGFVALSASRSLELLWGRRSHNLRRRGFEALSRMPTLRGLSTSLLNVEDHALAALADFPALRELMPMDVPDAGYRHIGRCRQLESLILMYCRDTTDAATEQLTGLDRLSYYFNSYTTITDRTPGLLATMPSLERITFDACHNLTDQGVQRLLTLPRLRELRVAGARLTPRVTDGFRPGVRVYYDR